MTPKLLNVKVSNLRKRGLGNSLNEWLKQNPKHLYIGRENSYVNIGRSKWANPFPLSKYTLEESLQKYEMYVRETPSLWNAITDELNDKVMGCWCCDCESFESTIDKPLRCHGEVLMKLFHEQHSKK